MPNGQKIIPAQKFRGNSKYVAEKVFSPFSRAITRLLIFSASSDDEVEGGTKKGTFSSSSSPSARIALFDRWEAIGERGGGGRVWEEEEEEEAPPPHSPE